MSGVLSPFHLPRAITRQSRIAVLAASGPSPLDRIELAASHLRSHGAEVTLARNIAHRGDRPYLAGTDDERADEVNRFLRDPRFDAFFFARGGYGAMRILDRLDYDAIAANPRPIIGFSDVTAIHQAVAVRCGLVTFHGPMLNLDFHDRLSPEIDRWFWSMLAGEAPLAHRFSPDQVIAEGESEGVLFGGCLSLTAALAGTPYDFWIDGGIWFWEDVDEPLYRLDRMLTHLKLSGRLPRIRGVIIGKLKNCGESADLLSLLRDFFGSLDIPVVRDLPFGHLGDNLLLPIGVPVRLSTRDAALTILGPTVTPR